MVLDRAIVRRCAIFFRRWFSFRFSASLWPAELEAAGPLLLLSVAEVSCPSVILLLLKIYQFLGGQFAALCLVKLRQEGRVASGGPGGVYLHTTRYVRAVPVT